MVLEELMEEEGLEDEEEIRTRSTGLPKCLPVLRITTVVSPFLRFSLSPSFAPRRLKLFSI